MPPMKKSPRSRTKARSSVMGVGDFSPGWTDGSKAVFLTPKSPSPVAKKTRRSSVNRAGLANKKQLSMVVSPPGVKTRARRSSIYQRGGARLISPKGIASRTRRASMYISSAKLPMPVVNEFSKVWATPLKPPPVFNNSPNVKNVDTKTVPSKAASELPASTKAKRGKLAAQTSPNNDKSEKTPKSTTKSEVTKSARKSVKRKASSPPIKSSASPEFNSPTAKASKQVKLSQSTPPPSSKKSAKDKKTISPPKFELSPETNLTSSKQTKAVPLDKNAKTKPATPELPAGGKDTKIVTQRSATKSERVKSARKSVNRKISSPSLKSAASPEFKTPAKTKSKLEIKKPSKSPGSSKKSAKKATSPAVLSPKFKTPAAKLSKTSKTHKSSGSTKSNKKSARKNASSSPASKALTSPRVNAEVSAPKMDKKGDAKALSVADLPAKTIISPPIYMTPDEAPIRGDAVFKFTATPSSRVGQKGKRKSVYLTPGSALQEPKQKRKYRKTPAVKHSESKVNVTKESVSESELQVTSSQSQMTQKIQMSPLEMTSLLRDVTEVEKRKAAESPSPRPNKIMKIKERDQSTPKAVKVLSRVTKKKLVDMVEKDVKLSDDVEYVDSGDEAYTSNETFSTDSRSSRCTIL